jgi:flavin reductase (DIM6/NTAB) family NADH-FMN oxidoreductase RutF
MTEDRARDPYRMWCITEKQMHFDLARIPTADAYKLLVSTVVPRPIALATTVDSEGRVNAAPFSFFNAVSSVPPVVVLGISPGAASEDGYKDTGRNIRDSGEFVVNLVDEVLAERMNICAIDFSAGTGELEKAELTPLPSVGVRPPRIAQSPVSFECRRITGLSLGPRSTLEVGSVIHIHRDSLPAPVLLGDRTNRVCGVKTKIWCLPLASVKQPEVLGDTRR